MVLAQDGDKAAYQQLLTEVTPYLRALVRRQSAGSLRDSADVEDAVQDVLLVVHRIRHTYERGRAIRPWLATIASRRVIDVLRRRSQRNQHESTEEDAESVAEVCAAADGNPEGHVARAHVSRKLRQAVSALPDRQREAVELLRWQELSLDEAAAVSRQTVGALKVAFHRALKSLRLALSKEH